jgi:hypothetical protein
MGETTPTPDYQWKVGDVFTNGGSRWAVDSIQGDKAVMRSCSSSWATTIPLTFNEWREGGRWQLERPVCRNTKACREPCEDVDGLNYCERCGLWEGAK